jgi:hypothetical protein
VFTGVVGNILHGEEEHRETVTSAVWRVNPWGIQKEEPCICSEPNNISLCKDPVGTA